MIDAVYRNYRVILLRDCTQAVEIPEVDGSDFAFTKRIVLWAECYLGYTVTSDQFVAACKRAQESSS
jgi:ureidoacrylate peracid hydrolase